MFPLGTKRVIHLQANQETTIQQHHMIEHKTRLYVDSSPAGLQTRLVQAYDLRGEEHSEPVNHTARAWTKTEAAYHQIEQEQQNC